MIDTHTSEQRRIVAVTASFEPALVRVRRRWPHLEILCTRLRVENGVYTGRIEEPLVGDAKVRAVAAHAAAHRVDLAKSFAYGDHHSDLPFMALAGESLFVAASQ